MVRPKIIVKKCFRITEYGGKTVLNPGAVGVPLESNGKAQYMLCTGVNEKIKTEFVSLRYDTERVISELYQSCMSMRQIGPG